MISLKISFQASNTHWMVCRLSFALAILEASLSLVIWVYATHPFLLCIFVRRKETFLGRMKSFLLLYFSITLSGYLVVLYRKNVTYLLCCIMWQLIETMLYRNNVMYLLCCIFWQLAFSKKFQLAARVLDIKSKRLEQVTLLSLQDDSYTMSSRYFFVSNLLASISICQVNTHNLKSSSQGWSDDDLIVVAPYFISSPNNYINFWCLVFPALRIDYVIDHFILLVILLLDVHNIFWIGNWRQQKTHKFLSVLRLKALYHSSIS